MPLFCEDCEKNTVIGWENEVMVIFFLLGCFAVFLYGLVFSNDWCLFTGIAVAGGTMVLRIEFLKAVLPYCPNCKNEYNKKIAGQIGEKEQIVGKMLLNFSKSVFGKYSDEDIDSFRSKSKQIDTLLVLNKFDEAMDMMERNGLMMEAAEIRKKSRIVNHINLDVNELVEQINQYGSLKSLICNNCGAPIENKDIIEGRKFCSYCGGAYDLLTVNEVLRQMLTIDLNTSDNKRKCA